MARWWNNRLMLGSWGYNGWIRCSRIFADWSSPKRMFFILLTLAWRSARVESVLCQWSFLHSIQLYTMYFPTILPWPACVLMLTVIIHCYFVLFGWMFDSGTSSAWQRWAGWMSADAVSGCRYTLYAGWSQLCRACTCHLWQVQMSVCWIYSS